MKLEYIDFLEKNNIKKTIIIEDSIVRAEETDIKDVLKSNKIILGIESKITKNSILFKKNNDRFMELVEILHILLSDDSFTIKDVSWDRISISVFLLNVKNDEWITVDSDSITNEWYLKHILFYKAFRDLPDEDYIKRELINQKE